MLRYRFVLLLLEKSIALELNRLDRAADEEPGGCSPLTYPSSPDAISFISRSLTPWFPPRYYPFSDFGQPPIVALRIVLKNEAIRSSTAYRPRYNSACRHGLGIPNTMAIPLFQTVFKLSAQYTEISSFLHNSTATHTICVASSLLFRQSLT